MTPQSPQHPAAAIAGRTGYDLGALLAASGARRERASDEGLKLVRRRDRNGATYFIVNASNKAVDGWVPLATSARSASRARSGCTRRPCCCAWRCR